MLGWVLLMLGKRRGNANFLKAIELFCSFLNKGKFPFGRTNRRRSSEILLRVKTFGLFCQVSRPNVGLTVSRPSLSIAVFQVGRHETSFEK